MALPLPDYSVSYGSENCSDLSANHLTKRYNSLAIPKFPMSKLFYLIFHSALLKSSTGKKSLKRNKHGIDHMVMANTGSALKYSNLVEVLTFLAKN